MKFGLEKCAMFMIKIEKRETTERLELTNQETIRTREEKETYYNLRILEVDSIKQTETKEKTRKEYLKITRKLLKTKLRKKNLIKRYLSSPSCKILKTIFKMHKGKTRKKGTKNKEIDDDAQDFSLGIWHRLYVSKNEGGKRLASIENCVNTKKTAKKDWLRS